MGDTSSQDSHLFVRQEVKKSTFKYIECASYVYLRTQDQQELPSELNLAPSIGP